MSTSSQCAGAVDGMHIPIQSPTECPANYYNRKGWHSVLIQWPTECPADYYNRKGWHSVLMHGVIDHRGRDLVMCILVGQVGFTTPESLAIGSFLRGVRLTHYEHYFCMFMIRYNYTVTMN